MQAGREALGKLIRKEFAGMPECRARMMKLVAEVESLYPGTQAAGVPARLCFAGFSQGAMTAMDATLALPPGRVAK